MLDISEKHKAEILKRLGIARDGSGQAQRLLASFKEALVTHRYRMDERRRSSSDDNGFFATPAGASVLRQKMRVNAIHRCARELNDLLGAYVSERGPYASNETYFVHELLDKMRSRNDLYQSSGIFDGDQEGQTFEEISSLDSLPSAKPPEIEGDEITANLLSDVIYHVELLEKSSENILAQWNLGRGKPKKYDVLIPQLLDICIAAAGDDDGRRQNLRNSPAAPGGALCLLFEIALEVLGEKAHSNPAAAVRSALQAHEAMLNEAERDTEDLHAHVAGKCTPETCHYCSELRGA